MAMFKKKVTETEKLPDDHFWADQENKNRLTPDLMDLEKSVWQRLFVPDNMMMGYPDYRLLKGYSTHKAYCFTEKHYSMWRNNDGNFPIVLQPSDPRDFTPWSNADQFISKLKHHARVKGQLFKVLSSRFPVLDNEYERGKKFNRIRINVDIPMRDVLKFGDQLRGIETKRRYTEQHECWMYIGLPQYWDNKLDGGFEYTPVKIFKPTEAIAEPYYFFTPQ